MRILMVSDFYPPHLGGTERMVADLSHELSRRGHHVEVATLWSDGLARRECDGAVVVHRLEGTTQRLPFLYKQAGRPFHPPLPDPLLTRRLGRLVTHLRPDVVHGHSWMMFSALPLRRTAGFAAVVTLHDYALLCPKKTLLYHEQRPCRYGLGRHCVQCAPQQYGFAKGMVTTAGLAVSRKAYKGVDTLIAISSYVAEVHAHDRATAHSPIVRVPNFVQDSVARAPTGPPLPNLPDDYMLFVGALGRHKGLYVLLDAYTRLKTALPLVLIGAVQHDTPASFPPGVIALPGVPHADILRAIDHCRFLLSPGLWPEPFGLVAIEGMARGKAVVAGRAGGMLDIVQDGKTGLLVTPGVVADLAWAMRRLIDDPALATCMGREGAAVCAATFSAGVVVRRIEDVYQDAGRRAGSLKG